MSSQRPLTTEELTAIIESDGFWDDINVNTIDIYITPPNDGNESEEDSGDEDESTKIDNLSGRQLQAQATATIYTENGITRLGDESNDDNDYDVEDTIPLAQLRNTLPDQRVQPVQRNWSKIDLSSSFDTFVCPKVPEDIPSDPISCFELFFDEEVCNFLVNMFITYAKSKGDHNFDINTKDLKCFLAILLLSGYIGVPRWRMLWETNTETYNVAVANAMRRNRFEQIKKYAHCADNANLIQNDKFAKVRPLFNKLNSRFLQYSQFTEHLSIDESMVPYYGRHSAKQFIRGKPIRYGYKMWCLCEPLGYLMQFQPYQGKENRLNSDLGVGGSVVMSLLSNLPQNVPFKIYGDRYFSSLKLVNRLKDIGYGYTGTIMTNRTEKCPVISGKIMEKKARGTYDFLTDTNTGITVTSWNDNRVVTTVSSCDPVEPPQEAMRWVSSEKKKMPITQPTVISKYNQYMGGVDRMDENIDRYRIEIRSKKWWWAVFAFCIDTSIHNAWQIYRRRESKISYLKFRREIVQIYLGKYGTPASGAGRPKTSKTIETRVPDGIRFDCISHWMVSAEKQNRCAVCKKNSTKKCEKCGVNLHEGCVLKTKFVPFQ